MLTKPCTGPYFNAIKKVLFSSSSVRFPKHKDLFTEDYYDAGKEDKNPYESEFPGGKDL